MAAAYGTAVFVGLRSKMPYIKDIYLDDTAGNLVRWDAGAGASATSPTDWTPAEPVVLRDLVIVAATGQTKTQICRNGVPTGDMIRNSNHLATVTVRLILGIIFNTFTKITMIQLA